MIFSFDLLRIRQLIFYLLGFEPKRVFGLLLELFFHFKILSVDIVLFTFGVRHCLSLVFLRDQDFPVKACSIFFDIDFPFYSIHLWFFYFSCFPKINFQEVIKKQQPIRIHLFQLKGLRNSSSLPFLYFILILQRICVSHLILQLIQYFTF